MGRGVNIPWIGVLYTMGRGSNYHGLGGGQNTMGKGVKIPCVERSKYHG